VGLALSRTDRATVAGPPPRAAGLNGQPSSVSRIPPAHNWLSVRLPFRPPLSPGNLFGHLAATAVPGVEEARGDRYRRTLRLAHGPGIVELTPAARDVNCRLMLSDRRDVIPAIALCRRLLDLDADPRAVDGHLATDPNLRPLIERAPGRRIPRCIDGAELGVRAVLGQQISTAAARTHAGRLAAALGDPVNDPRGSLTRLFPTPAALQQASFAVPGSRRRTLAALLAALSSGELSLEPGGDRDRTLETLARLPGIGPWTTAIIAMRALGDPDAFPSTDLGVRRGAEALGLPGAAAPLTAYAERWRPWRAYAVQYLWSVLDHPINRWPLDTVP
jgi:AraC family transcriptional regulator of adaptative response / DNA-3-methyladenine glycosylase II